MPGLQRRPGAVSTWRVLERDRTSSLRRMPRWVCLRDRCRCRANRLPSRLLLPAGRCVAHRGSLPGRHILASGAAAGAQRLPRLSTRRVLRSGRPDRAHRAVWAGLLLLGWCKPALAERSGYHGRPLRQWVRLYVWVMDASPSESVRGQANVRHLARALLPRAGRQRPASIR